MPEGQVLEFSGLTKRFGGVTAVSNLSARVEPGKVTGFLGPNGAGKTTTLRVLLGLVRADAGTATLGGEPYSALRHPLQTVGAVLEASSFHPGRTAANHLKVYARAAGLPVSRVDETLDLVGLTDAGGRKVGGFSLGMRQRLGLAYALLGDPGVLVLDEPTNGLDPEGIKWVRVFLRQLAAQGRTVLVSSHLLAEVQQTVDALLIVSQGRLVYQGALEDLADHSEYVTVVDSPDREGLGSALTAAGASFDILRSGLTVRGLEAVEVGAIAASAGVALSSLQRRGPALEEVFLELISGARVHPTAGYGAAEPVEAVLPPRGPDTDALAVAAVSGAEAAAVSAELEAESISAPGAAAAAGTATGVVLWSEEDAGAAGSQEPDPAPEPEPVTTHTASFTVASTGVIDIVPTLTDEPTLAEPALDGDGDGDVEALGDIDAELSTDRPWEKYEKKESDVEADAFFAAFTEDTAPESADGEPVSPQDEGSEQR